MQLTVFEGEAIAAPDDRVAGEARDPDSHGREIAKQQ
jgi:hypothetical protein